jgi:hypothetical protein
MADYTFKVPHDKGADYMIGAIRPPQYGEGPHTFVIVSGDPLHLFYINATSGVLQIQDEGYSDADPFPEEIVVEVGYEGVLTQYTVALQKFIWLERKRNTVYVDSFNGSNTALGGMRSPVSSMDLALDMLRGGGVLLLYPGEYGNRVIQKRTHCKVKGLGKDPWANFGGLSVDNGLSVTVDQLSFDSAGVVAVNGASTQRGSITVRRSKFRGLQAVEVDNYRYANIHQNDIGTQEVGIDLRRVEEGAVHSNNIHGTIVT